VDELDENGSGCDMFVDGSLQISQATQWLFNQICGLAIIKFLV